MWLTNSKSCHKTLKQQGFSLVELMIGLVIGLMVALVVTNVFSVFEKQKRTTTGSSDAQTNGAIALYNLQRDAQSAGYGLPVYGSTFSPYNCPIATTVDHDNNGGNANIGMSPIVITDGVGQNGSDTISIHAGDSMRGGIAMPMVPGTATILPNVVQVDTNIGCAVGDVALVVNYAAALNCNMTRVTALTAAGVSPATITLASVTNVAAGNAVSCLGVWDEFQYTVNANNQLTRSGALVGGVPSVAAVPIVTDIVNIQAQYGVSAVTPAIGQASNQVIQWVDATGIWDAAAITPSNRNRIKAIRVAVVARNGLLEAANVTAACSALNATNPTPTGLCAWAGSVASPAPAVSLVADPNWMRYRYRVYETIIPIKNVILSRQTLQ